MTEIDQKLKCVFGFHKWTRGNVVRHCVCCKLRQINIPSENHGNDQWEDSCWQHD